MQKIHKTTDYSKFKYLKGNRETNKAHKASLNKSIHKNGALFSIIIVNEKFEIIDGQHRFEIFQELGLPIYYVIKRGYGLKHVQTYNQNSKNWSLKQFLESYVGMGLEDYKVFKFFHDKYNFGYRESMVMLTGGSKDNSVTITKKFKAGTFKATSLQSAVDVADKIYDFAKYYEQFKRRGFVLAIIKLIRNHDEYDHDQMLAKVKYQSAKLTDQVTVDNYLKVLEKIYNYKTRNDHYIRFDLAA